MQNQLKIVFEGIQQENISIMIFSIDRKLIFTKAYNISITENYLDLSRSIFPNQGIYIMQLKLNDDVSTNKIVVE